MIEVVDSPKVVVAARATLAYNPSEDRISLACAFSDSQCVVLWLTARLASQLVPHLGRMGDGTSTSASAGRSQDATDQDVPAVSEPQDGGDLPLGGSRSAHNKGLEAPVVAEPDSESWVVTAIDITNGPMLIQLRFRGDQGHTPVLLSLEHLQLAQWLEGLKRCFTLAGWPVDCWDMLASAGPQSHALRQVSVH